MIGNGGKIEEILNFLNEDAAHESLLFPEDSNETMTLTAHASADTFSAWTEIVDNNAVTFSSKLALKSGYISSTMAESASATDKVYIYEISYGAAKTVIGRGRLMSGSVRISNTQQARFRGLEIPAGETVYYRIKCETGGADITASIRYHTHD